MESLGFLKQMVEALGEINHRKNRMCYPILIKNIEGEKEKLYCKT
jgi:hypothetical protein